MLTRVAWWAALVFWLMASGADAQPPAPPPPAAMPQKPAATASPPTTMPARDVPDEGLIEFLGSDDVGDAAWWEFLKKAPPRGNVAPARPQDMGQ